MKEGSCGRRKPGFAGGIAQVVKRRVRYPRGSFAMTQPGWRASGPQTGQGHPEHTGVGASSARVSGLGQDEIVFGPEKAKRRKERRDLLRIPIVGSVACGNPVRPAEVVEVFFESLDGNAGQLATGMGEGWIWEDSMDIANPIFAFGMANKNAPIYGVRVNGTSRVSFYADKDLVLVELTSDTASLKDGDHIVVDLQGSGEGSGPSGQYVLKQYQKDPPLLNSVNHRFKVIYYPEHATLFGRVVALFRVGVLELAF